jgi:FkbM family methyltransferase
MPSAWDLIHWIAVLAMAAAIGVILLILLRLRRLLRTVECETESVREQIDRSSGDRSLWSARLEQDLGTVRAEAQRTHSDTATRLRAIADDLNSVSSRNSASWTTICELNDRISRISTTLDDRISQISIALDELTPKPAAQLTLDPEIVSSIPEADILSIAPSLAVLRPLVPYPGWHFDLELCNNDFCHRLRRWFWQHFHDLQRDAPVVIRWHEGTSLRVFLGNDLSARLYITGCWEPNEFAFLNHVLLPGMTFLDVGANDGVFTVFAAKRLGPQGVVWAFEPSARELDRLRFNLELNRLAARVFPVALAETNGQAQLTVADHEHEMHNTLGALIYEETSTTETIALRRLDDIVGEDPPARIDVMKIDVEGAELRVLRGAATTLLNYRPILLFEVLDESLRNQGCSAGELLGFVCAQGYNLHFFDPATGVLLPAPAGVCSDNMVGVPVEKSLPDCVRSPWPLPYSPWS